MSKMARPTAVAYGLILVFTLQLCEPIVGVDIFNLPAMISVDEDKVSGYDLFTVEGNGTLPLKFVVASTEPPGGPFSIDETTGDVKLSAGPDFETVPSYVVTINATDGIHVASANLAVTINDVDEGPIFLNLPETVDVLEDTVGATTIYTVNAIDPENKLVVYAFSVVPNDGTIEFDGANVKLIANPDFTAPSYKVTVTATAGPIDKSTLTVDITNVVNDVPIISNIPQPKLIEETTPVGTSMLKIKATDADGDRITYAIEITKPVNSTTFTVDASGDIKLAQPVDYESGVHLYIVRYKACDAESCSDWHLLHVVIRNANDPPKATYSPAEFSVPENQVEPFSLPVVYNVTDDDGDDVFTFALVTSPNSALFTIDAATGNLTLVKAVDLEDRARFPDQLINITVSIRDANGAEGFVNISMGIDDDNEFDPVFTELLYKGKVTENAKFSTSVLTLNATDEDLGPVFGRVTYVVDPPGKGLFLVNTLSSGLGLLLVVGIVDREKFPDGYIRFKVHARDGGLRVGALAATVELEVEDVNDRLPEFTQKVYEFTIRADAPIGTAVGNVRAVDGDALPQLVTYKMITNDTTIRSKFFINYLDGQVTVNGALMDGQTYEMYAFATEHNTTRSAPEMALVRVKTYNQVATLVDWELDTDGRYMGKSEIEEFERRLAATCPPCWPKVVESFEKDNGNWVFRVNIATAKVNGTAASFMSKNQILDLFTTDGRKTPTDVARDVAPSGGKVVSINESFIEVERNWWLETAGGIIVLILLCLVAFAIVSTLIAVFFDFVWYSRRAEARIY